VNRNVLVFIVVAIVVTGMLVAGKYLAKPREGSSGALGAQDPKGVLAPDFQLASVDGKQVKLSEYRGKAVLLNFWATWCPPCKIEIPWFVELQQQYAPEGLQVIGVAMDDGDSRDKVGKMVQELKMNYPVLLGNDHVADLYGGVEGLPLTFYIGRDGKIVKRVAGLAGHREVVENIQAALKQGQSTGSADNRPQRAQVGTAVAGGQ